MAQHDVFHQTDRVNKRRLRAACFIRFVSVLVFIKLALTLGGLAFLSLRSSHPITLAPFETHEVRFCPSWFRGVDVVAPFPANEYVTVHKFKGRPNVTEENETYRVGYDLELKTGQFGRTHSRSYFFPAGTTFDLEFESTTPVNFFVLHPEHRKERRENHWSPRNEGHGPHHGERHHGHHREGHHGGHANNQPQTHSNYGHEAAVKKEFRITASGGRYDLIFSLPKNVTTHARVAVRIVASVKTLDISRSCPLRSSLARGHRHVRLHGHAREHVVLAASPYARTSSLVYVRLVPREHKFAAVSAILFAVYVVLRLIARYLRAHSGLQKGQGKCFWSRLCGRKNQYTVVPQEPHVQVVYPATL